MKYNIPLAKKFIRFMSLKGSIIVKDYTKVIKNPFDLEEYDNYFYSINSYIQNPKYKEEIYLNKFNGFLFDIDIKENGYNGKNKDIIKAEIREKVLNYFDYDNEIVEIHIINETSNGFHLLHFFEKPIEIHDIKNQRLKYNEEYQKTKEFLENKMNLVIDKGALKTTQIGSVPGTWRFKEKEGGKKSGFMIKIIRGQKSLEIDESRKRIEKLDIAEVASILKLKEDLKTGTLIENGETTNGYKINKKENYINNFTLNKKRALGSVFVFVVNYYKVEGMNQRDAYNEAWKFFKTNFGIISQADSKTKIKINKFLHLNTALDNSLTQENKKYILFLNNYLSLNGFFDNKITDRIDIKEFKSTLGNDKLKLSTIKKNLEELKDKILNINTEEKSFIKETKLINIEFKKEKGVKFRFIFLPEKNKSHKNIIYNVNVFHYLNKKIIDLNISNNLIIDFYLHLASKMLFKKKEELYLENSFLDNFGFNKNVSLRKKLLENIGKITNDFYVKKEQKGFIFCLK